MRFRTGKGSIHCIIGTVISLRRIGHTFFAPLFSYAQRIIRGASILDMNAPTEIARLSCYYACEATIKNLAGVEGGDDDEEVSHLLVVLFATE
jgi:hypothetical protein